MIIAVIPARYDSTRLPGKPLKILGDKPIIQHVYEKAEAARVFDRVIVATDDVRIYKKVKSFGGKVQMTSASHQSGSDRIAEVVRGIPAVEIVVNVQGDEPFITSSALQHLVKLFEDDEVQVASLMHRMKKGFDNPNRVKVVCDEHNFALYFSRLPVPYHGKNEKLVYYQHIGVYGYRKEILLEFMNKTPTFLEKKEKLEQLRFLEKGIKIKMAETDYAGFGIDTLEDLQAAEKLLNILQNATK